MGNWSRERESNLPQITESLNGRARIWIQGIWIRLCSITTINFHQKMLSAKRFKVWISGALGSRKMGEPLTLTESFHEENGPWIGSGMTGWAHLDKWEKSISVSMGRAWKKEKAEFRVQCGRSWGQVSYFYLAKWTRLKCISFPAQLQLFNEKKAQMLESWRKKKIKTYR